jgi:hypothetical protein
MVTMKLYAKLIKCIKQTVIFMNILMKQLFFIKNSVIRN